MRRLAQLALLVLALHGLTACTRHGARTAANIAFVGLAVGAAISDVHMHVSRPAIHDHVYVERVYVERTVVTTPEAYGRHAPPARAPEPETETDTDTELRPFDTMSARIALKKAALGECKQHGAPRGHGHANVVFTPEGTVSHVTIDAPAGLPPEAVTCLGDRLAASSIAPFNGGSVSVGTTFFVK